MSESIKRRTATLATDKESIRKLMAAVLVDLGVLRTPIAAGVTDYTAGRAEIAKLVTDVTAIRTRQQNMTFGSAGLAIASGKKTATIGTAFCYIAGGTVFYKAAADCSALVGTIADGKTAAWAFYINASGTVTTSSKTADADNLAAAMVLAQAIAVPANLALIGYLVVATSGATFVGGTTDLDAGTATDIYINVIGPGSAPVAITAVAPAAVTAVTPAALTLTE